MTFEEVKSYFEENEIEMVDFKVIDVNGRMKHLTIPAARFTEDTMTYGIGFDGSNYGYAAVEKSDMVFVPDLNTLALEPYADLPTATMFGDVYVIGAENTPFDQYPRNVARAAVSYMKQTGAADRVDLGPEFEFYVFDNVNFKAQPQGAGYNIDCEYAEWNTGMEVNHGYQIPHHGGYHAALPQDFSYNMRSRVCALLEENGCPVKYHHTEVGGPGQVEIEVAFGELTDMADRTMLVKYFVMNQAMCEGYTATFMPKPIYKEAGNGMHVHIILSKDGQPVFFDEKGYSQLSDTALYFIGGLCRHAASLCGITNPSTNSYKRLVPGFEAPVTIGYATANRSAIVRIPAYAKAPKDKRFELRNPDATCNPYYAYAAILMAGLDGIEKKIDPSKNGWGPYDYNLFALSDEEKAKVQGLPHSLEEALDALEADHEYLTKGGVFPEVLIKNWIRAKRADAAELNAFPHPLEFTKYYTL